MTFWRIQVTADRYRAAMPSLFLRLSGPTFFQPRRSLCGDVEKILALQPNRAAARRADTAVSLGR
jgi:hypothetical protein